eukprot:8861407-Lingulodinium_polyedra.AAC.1
MEAFRRSRLRRWPSAPRSCGLGTLPRGKWTERCVLGVRNGRSSPKSCRRRRRLDLAALPG